MMVDGFISKGLRLPDLLGIMCDNPWDWETIINQQTYFMRWDKGLF